MTQHIEDVLGRSLPADHSRHVTIYHYLPEHLRAPETRGLIVDFGCGAGKLVARMAHEYPHVRSFGVDSADSSKWVPNWN